MHNRAKGTNKIHIHNTAINNNEDDQRISRHMYSMEVQGHWLTNGHFHFCNEMEMGLCPVQKNERNFIKLQVFWF